MLTKASGDGEMLLWERVDHPQLGAVEIGGIDYLRTIRNPPLSHLPTECEHTFSILDKIRMSLPKVHNKVLVETIAEGVHRITMHIENRGYLPTAGLQRALDLKLTNETYVEMVCPEDVELIGGVKIQSVWHHSMDGVNGKLNQPRIFYTQVCQCGGIVRHYNGWLKGLALLRFIGIVREQDVALNEYPLEKKPSNS